MLLHQFMNGALEVMHPTPLQKDTTFTKIFVGGLPYHTNDASLRKYFEAFGDIDEAVVITDRQTGKSRGYGFVSTNKTAAHDVALIHNFEHQPRCEALICGNSAVTNQFLAVVMLVWSVRTTCVTVPPPVLFSWQL